MAELKGERPKAEQTYPRVGNPAVSLHERRGAKVLVLVPPVARAARRAARAENALVHAERASVCGDEGRNGRRTRRASGGPLVTAGTRDLLVGCRS